MDNSSKFSTYLALLLCPRPGLQLRDSMLEVDFGSNYNWLYARGTITTGYILYYDLLSPLVFIDFIYGDPGGMSNLAQMSQIWLNTFGKFRWNGCHSDQGLCRTDMIVTTP